MTNAPVLPLYRLALLGLAGAALLAGLSGALLRLGLALPGAPMQFAAEHGLLMVLGFLGTLIALERAVALGRRWAYLGPLATGLGGLCLILGVPGPLSGILLTAGGALFVAMYAAFDRIERSLHTSVQAVGAVAWLVAALLLLAGESISAAVPWLAAFLVLTICGERLELSRLGNLSDTARRAFIGAAAVFCAGVTVTLAAPDPGTRLAGAGLLALAAWLARNDVARRTVRKSGVTRFIAVSLLSGYAWLAAAGACWLAFGSLSSGFGYDAMLHALFLGFVISMVFGHAPVIVPAVLRTPLPYRSSFYAHLVLLHAGLLLRVVAGDIPGVQAAWQLGGTLNVLAILLFVASSAFAVMRGRAPTPLRDRRLLAATANEDDCPTGEVTGS